MGWNTKGRLALAMLGAWCAAAPLLNVDARAQDAELVRGLGDSWQSLDPQVGYLLKDAFILSDVYEGLIALDAAGEPVPGAAESWTVDPTGKVYTFRLREGLAWANGKPLTAKDFVNGMKRMLDPATASYKVYRLTSALAVTGAAEFNAGTLKDFLAVGIKAPDDRTVEIQLDHPNPRAINLLNTYTTLPAPSDLSDPAAFLDPAAAIANGAYMIKEVVPQSHVLSVEKARRGSGQVAPPLKRHRDQLATVPWDR